MIRTATEPSKTCLPMAWAALIAALASGCGQTGSPTESSGPAAAIQDRGTNQNLFETSVDNIDHLEQFDAAAMLAQAVQGLNQSLAGTGADDSWQPDPLIFSLPLEYRELPEIKQLGVTTFDFAGALELQEAFWLRDASRAARGKRIDDLARAASLFDWVVRNIQLEPDVPPGGGFDLLHAPRQLLLFGRGDALERAWLFVLLARQQGLDVVMLCLTDAERSEGYRPWLPALVSGGQFYLFDARLGLPIPGPGEQSIATLEQVADDDSLLRALDVDGEPYPVTAADAGQVIALVEASPAYLSRRMRMVELRLTGDRKVVLTIAASALAERLRSMKHVKGTGLWDLPYRALAQQELPAAREAAARELAHYQVAILPQDLRPVAAALQQGRLMHIRGVYMQAEDESSASANAMYSHARLPKADLDRLNLEPQQRALLDHTKQDASFWLGLVAFERERYPGAIDHFRKRTLEESPTGPWTAGARYNLARCYEALGRYEEAIALYEQDDSPQRHGNLLRARRLKALAVKPAG